MKQLWKKWRNDFLVGGGILILAFFLRLYNLTIIPVFGDEAIYIRWSQVMRAEPTLRFVPLSDGKQPLFMWAVIPFFKIFSDPLIAGRIVSVFSGLGTVIGIFVLTQLLFKSRKMSLLASLIYAISPFSIFFDRLALADSMLSMFGVWALVFGIITVKKVRLDTAILTGFSLGGALLTKSPAVFFAALTPTTLLLHEWPKKLKEKFNKFSIFVFLFTFTYIIALGMYNILRLGPNFHMIAIRNKDYVYPLSHILERPLDPLLPYLDRILEYYWILGPSVLVLLTLFGIFVGLKRKTKETLILLAWGIIPILFVAEFSKTMTARYVYFSVPYLLILASISLGAKLIHPPGGLLKLINENEKVKGANLFHPKGVSGLHVTVLNILFIIFVANALVLDYQLLTNPQTANLPRSERSGYLEEWTSGYGIKEVSEIIRKEYRDNPEGKIVVGTEGYFGTLPDGLQMYLANVPEVTVIGVGLSIKDVPQSLKESKAYGNKTYLVINSTRFLGDLDTPDMDLKAVYGKGTRPDGSHESLLLFEVVKNQND